MGDMEKDAQWNDEEEELKEECKPYMEAREGRLAPRQEIFKNGV